MILFGTTVLVSLGSALIPLINIEAYLLGVGALSHSSAAHIVLLAVAAGVGQTMGKIIWYELARHGLQTRWVQRKLERPKIKASYEKWVARMGGRPVYAGMIMFLAASVGLPPMLVMAVVGGALRMNRAVFISTVLVGRTLRFWAILAGIDVAIGH